MTIGYITTLIITIYIYIYIYMCVCVCVWVGVCVTHFDLVTLLSQCYLLHYLN